LGIRCHPAQSLASAQGRRIAAECLPSTECAAWPFLRVQVGDRVLAVNETEVSSSRPVKSVTIDLSDGDIAHFRMRRARTSSTTNQAPQAASPVPTPLPPTPPTAAYLELPPSGPVNGAMPAAPLAPVNGAMAAAPLGATAAPTPTTSAEDDLLLRRLEMLKRS